MTSRPGRLYTCDHDRCTKAVAVVRDQTAAQQATVRPERDPLDGPSNLDGVVAALFGDRDPEDGPPPGWVVFSTLRGIAKDGSNVAADGLVFCGPQHATSWFSATVDPPAADEPSDG